MIAAKYEGCDFWLQNVKPEKLFSKERAVKQLLDIIEGVLPWRPMAATLLGMARASPSETCKPYKNLPCCLLP